MQIKCLRGDFGPLGCGNQPSLVLWLIFVEWDIDLGSTFCKYLPHGCQEGSSTAAEGKQPLFLFKVWDAMLWILVEQPDHSLRPVKLMKG